MRPRVNRTMITPAATDPSPRLRDAVLADTTRIAEIYAHYVRTSVATFEEVPPDAVEIAARFHKVTTLGLPWIVIEDHEGVQGYAYAGPFRDRSAYRFTVEDSIYIDADHLRCGYGTRLLGELVARCEALGKRQMIAVVGGSQSAGSISLHTRLGFKTAGILPSAGFKFGNWTDSVLMIRPLGKGGSTPPQTTA
jgi:L-amino acid N-acyltransferase YncA